MALADARLKKNPNDTAAMYAEGISYGLRSNYYWVVKKSWHDSLKDATAARKLHNRISELEPNNVDARLVQGLHDYIVGSLPLGYKMLGFMIGIHGDKEKGIRTVQDVAKNGKLNRVDAEIFLCALYRRENQSKLAVPLVAGPHPPLSAQLPPAHGTGANVQPGGRWRPRTAGGGGSGAAQTEPRPGLRPRAVGEDLLPGRIDPVLVQRPRPFAREHEEGGGGGEDVDLNTGVHAYLRMGQIYDMKKRRAEAIEAYKKAIAYAPQAEAAQESRKYLATPYRRM